MCLAVLLETKGTNSACNAAKLITYRNGRSKLQSNLEWNEKVVCADELQLELFLSFAWENPIGSSDAYRS